MDKSQPLENYLNKGLSYDELIEMKQAFDMFDINKCGEIDTDELKQSLLELGTNQTLESMINYINNNALSTIDFGTFLDIIVCDLDNAETNEDLQIMFNHFLEDNEKSKEIDIQKIAKKYFHEKITQNEIDNIVANSDGKITFENFVKFMNENVSS
jgi:Ca2+-binding EF-hand superfamily protein